MRSFSKMSCLFLISAMTGSALAEIITPKIEMDFQSRKKVIENAGNLHLETLNLTKKQSDALKMLYAYMPLPDMTDRDADYYIEYVVDPALKAREEMPWGSKVNDTLFRHFVLPIRVNNEALDRHRPEFYAQLKERVKGLSMEDAILEVNHWCHEKATYQPSDGRTHSPLQTVSSAIGRCGEESTFTVAALRSIGIPARQVYTPRWAHTDDNHAWVEAWADGKWHFLGACEPEPVLDLGWFNAPASRGMLMHARVFGNYEGSEERLEKIDGITFINVTDHYAPIDTITVKAVYPDGTAAADANASFRLYNYAEFYPIAEKKTDEKGEASLVAGLGDLLLWVTDGNQFGFRKGSVGKDRRITVTLDHKNGTKIKEDLDITPPAGRNAEVAVSEALRKANDLLMQREDSLRNAYIATFCSEEETGRMAEILEIDAERLMPIMRKARGNHAVITGFLRSLPQDTREKGLLLLESLTEKDLTDVSRDVLDDHITSVDESFGPLFGEYVMSPRIASEELTPFRRLFANAFPHNEAEAFRKDPQKWIDWVFANIIAKETWYPEQITMSPEAVWELRETSPLSRDVFLVAGARSLGIPARIDPVTGKAQWADRSGKWNDAVAESIACPQGTLKLEYEASDIIPDPQYYAHFTVSKITDGIPYLLNYPDFIALSETFTDGEALDRGFYLTVTGQRMADGSVLARMESADIDADEVSMPLTIRQDDSKVQVIGSFDSESRYLPDGATKETSILSTTGRGYYVLALLKPNHEPSNHVVRDLAEASSRLEASGRPILLLSEGSDGYKSGLDLRDFPTLPSTARLGYDSDGSILEGIAEGINLSGTELPILIVADTFNRVVFLSQGYTIGIGDKLVKLLSKLKN
ncbi:MAG: transglutaminase-like domain-containing protein [Muribaculaceae bacterium]|nr:transglutaminase-like domain-containing protein [Muribaculaceae bacterium]